MIGRLKQQVRGKLEQKWEREYETALSRKTKTYDSFVKSLESVQTLEEIGPYPSMAVVTWEELGRMEIPENALNLCIGLKTLGITEDIVIFVPEKRGIASLTERELAKIFNFYPEVQLVYGDEDEWNSSETARLNPWYKPDFSPDTLGSCYYFGSLLAVRAGLLEKVWFGNEDTCETGNQSPEASNAAGKQRLYSLALQCCIDLKREEVYHCQKILYHSHCIEYWGMEEEYASLREEYRQTRPGIAEKGVSVIIPSKDNPQVLENCIASIRKWTKDADFEIIVVDNGSSPENKEKIENLKIKYKFNYTYSPMEFNFSAMCNMGAEKSNKEHLLFLNDDCEVRQSRWLQEMVEASCLKSVGAVGVKLYYPNSKKIQHCGIYGLHLGPVHKLQFKEDIRSYYDRRNKDTRNVLAVTAACLMVKKALFHEAGGFYEGLRVAFNDVDFCYRLYEMGCDNVVLNDVHLWHHESLSRGNDEGPEKLERLMQEKKELFRRHPELWRKDPYYHPLFTTDILDINFSCRYEYTASCENIPSCENADGDTLAILTPESLTLSSKVRVDNCLTVVMEYAGRAEDWNLEFQTKRDENKIRIYFQGNALVLGSNNACYENYILLRHRKTGALYGVTPERVYRPDVVMNVEGQQNVELSGFACYVDTETLPKGSYEVAILAEDKISHRGILRPTTRIVTV